MSGIYVRVSALALTLDQNVLGRPYIDSKGVSTLYRIHNSKTNV